MNGLPVAGHGAACIMHDESHMTPEGCLLWLTGLMAWIVEKFRTWSACGGDVLTNVAI